MNCRLSKLLFAVVALAVAFRQSAAAEDLVVVPYDDSQPLSGQTPRTYYLDAQAFTRLWERAGRAPADDGTSGGESYTMVEALHDAEWREEGIVVKARYRVWVDRAGWVRIPFSFPGTVVQTVSVDGAPGAYDGGDLLVQEAGWHLIESDYQVSRAANGREAQWQVPPATASLLRVSGVPQAPVINEGLATLVERQEERTVVTTALGSGGSVHLLLDGPARAPAVQRPPLARVESLLTVSPGLRSLRAEVTWEFPGSALRQFGLGLEEGYAPARLEIPNLETWKLVRGESGTRLEFLLTAPVSGSLKIALEAESTFGPAATSGRGAFPRVRPEATRLEETLILAGAGGLQVGIIGSEGTAQRVAIPERFREGLSEGRAVAALRANGGEQAVFFEVERNLSQDVVRADLIYQLEPAGLNLFVHGTLKVAEAPRLIPLGLPAGAQVREFVSDGGIARSWRSGDTFWLQCDGASAGREVAYRMTLTIPGEAEASKGRCRLPELKWPADLQVHGDGLVLRHAAAESTLSFADPERVMLYPAASAMPDFAVLPPYQRAHAFAYTGGGFGADVDWQETPAVFDAGWVLSAVVHETWIQLSYHLDVDIKMPAVRQLTVRVASGVPELRWEGGALRGVESVVDGANRVYTLTFPEELTDFVHLTATTELPLVQGGARLPHLDLPQARQQSQFGVLENRTRGGLETNLARVEEVPGESVPYLPRKMNNPKFYRMTGPDWFLGVGLTRLESVGGMEMVITGSEIVTAIRENGEEWHHVAYRMRNQSLQFLPVKLSREMELIAVRVAAKEVQPKRGPEDRRTETLLIPLEPTGNGDLPFLVELVYRRPSAVGEALGDHFRRRLEAPEVDLGGRGEAQTFWRIYLPKGYEAHKVAGVVNLIPARQRAKGLTEANLEELERLARVARTGNEPESAWRNVLGLAELTREFLLAELGSEAAPADWQTKIDAMEGEAKAFRPRADVSLVVGAPGADAGLTGPGSGFVANSAAVLERNRQRHEARREGIAAARDRIRLDDFVAVAWNPPPASQTAEAGGAGTDERFGFAEAQAEMARELLESWQPSGRGAESQGTGRTIRFGLDLATPSVPPTALGPWVESTERPRFLVELDAAAVNERLWPGIGFPVSGEPMDFHKLRGKAQLELAGHRKAQRDLGPVWGWFAGTLLAIHLLARVTGRVRPVQA